MSLFEAAAAATHFPIILRVDGSNDGRFVWVFFCPKKSGGRDTFISSEASAGALAAG